MTADTAGQADAQGVKHTQEFRFLRAVVAVSVLTVILLFAYSILFQTPSFTNLIAENTEGTAIMVATHIKKDLFPSGKPFAKHALPPGFAPEITAIIKNFNLMKIKVFAPNGETIFSTEAKDIGVMNTHDYFHQVVAKGKPYSKIVKKDDASLEGQKVAMDVVETYVPAMADSTFLGAFEIYLNITASKAKLDHLVNRSNQLLLAISSGLLLAMLFIARRASANLQARRRAEAKIIQQRAVLEETNQDLSIMNEISTVISRAIDLDQLLPEILDTIATRCSPCNHISQGGIFLVAGKKLLLAAHLGHGDKFLSQYQETSLDDPLYGQAARSGQAIFAAGPEIPGGNATAEAPPTQAIVPLIAQDKVVGVLALGSVTDTQLRSKEPLLLNIGRQIGMAINNASLFQQTKYLAMYDQLTGLPNRRYMEARRVALFSVAERYHRPLSVAMIDIDFFKKYNDTLGHAAGDRILAKVGAIISQELREADFAARFGGEEFLVLLTETDQCGACIGMERLRGTIQHQAGVTISIGVTSHRAGITMEQLVKEADDALYQAKANGRNRVVWCPAIQSCHKSQEPGLETASA